MSVLSEVRDLKLVGFSKIESGTVGLIGVLAVFSLSTLALTYRWWLDASLLVVTYCASGFDKARKHYIQLIV